MKQIELAKKCNITEAMASYILNGERRPSWDVAKALAAATGTGPELWLDGTPEQKQAALKGIN